MSTYITREIAKQKDMVHKYVNNVFVIKFILSIVLFIFTGLLLFLLGYSTLTLLVTLIFTLEYIFISMSGLLIGVFQAFEELKYQSIGTILNSGFILLGILITMALNWGVLAISASYTIAYLIFFIYLIIVYMKKYLL